MSNYPTPLAAVVIDSADELQATASFVKLLFLHQSDREWNVFRGVGKWVNAIRRGEEAQVAPAVEGAKADVAGHPFEAEIVALITSAMTYVDQVVGNYQSTHGYHVGVPFQRWAGMKTSRPGPTRVPERRETVVLNESPYPKPVRLN